ncbi:MAG: serine/threonine protein kinase, partial [Archangium sp.]
MSCPSAEQLAEFASGTGDSRDSIEQHLDTCGDCRRVVAEVAGLESTRVPSSGSEVALAPLKPGTLVGRYEVKTVAGAGGMGVIYAAHDPTLNRI